MSQTYYRKNVCMITFRGDKFLLVNPIIRPANFWKFPQGGINYREPLLSAVKREFQEELGNDKIKIIAKSKIVRIYDWVDTRAVKNKTYRGQNQRFVIVEFLGSDGDIKIQEDEIRAYCWSEAKNLKKMLIKTDFGFENYWQIIEKVLEENRMVIPGQGKSV